MNTQTDFLAHRGLGGIAPCPDQSKGCLVEVPVRGFDYADIKALIAPEKTGSNGDTRRAPTHNDDLMPLRVRGLCHIFGPPREKFIRYRSDKKYRSDDK